MIQEGLNKNLGVNYFTLISSHLPSASPSTWWPEALASMSCTVPAAIGSSSPVMSTSLSLFLSFAAAAALAASPARISLRRFRLDLIFLTFRRQIGHRECSLNHCLMQAKWNMWPQESLVARPAALFSPSPHSCIMKEHNRAQSMRTSILWALSRPSNLQTNNTRRTAACVALGNCEFCE